MLDRAALEAKVNRNAGDDVLVTLSDPEGDIFRGTANGHPIRIEFSYHPSDPAQYRHQVWVFDETTNARIGMGNGGDSPSDAVSVYHWNELGIYFRGR